MSIISFERNATILELAAENDRRGAVIAKLEAERDKALADMDAVVHALEIEDSFKTPVEVINEIIEYAGFAAARIADLEGELSWSPIQTAPKDGTWFLGWAERDSAPFRVSWGRNHRGELAWCTAFAAFVEGYLTHWMPLREPAPRDSNPANLSRESRRVLNDDPIPTPAREEEGAAAAPLLVAEEWRPIETAPKDGTPILVTRHDETFGWVRGWAQWESERGISGWVARGFFAIPGVLGLANPTHWQHLPAPPIAAIRERGKV